jgi:DNA-binding CsgD family transcriptional regulator
MFDGAAECCPRRTDNRHPVRRCVDRAVRRQRSECGELPPSISSEPDDDHAFRRDWFYENYLLSAGFRDGMGSAITAPNRLLGTINVSCTRDTYGLEERMSLGLVTTAIARLVDVSGRLASQPRRPSDPSPIALISGGLVTPVPDEDAIELLGDPELVDVVRTAGPSRYEFLWSSATQWWRLVIESADIPILGADARVIRARPMPSPHGLSHREAEVLTCLALGMGNDAIAKLLVLSPRTVHRHVENILRKTNNRSRAGAAALAWREHCLVPRAGLGGLGVLAPPLPQRVGC